MKKLFLFLALLFISTFVFSAPDRNGVPISQHEDTVTVISVTTVQEPLTKSNIPVKVCVNTVLDVVLKVNSFLETKFPEYKDSDSSLDLKNSTKDLFYTGVASEEELGNQLIEPFAVLLKTEELQNVELGVRLILITNLILAQNCLPASE